MSTKTYAKRPSLLGRIWERPLAGAGRLEIAVLALTVLAGIVVGVALDNFLLGFAAIAALGLIARLLLELTGSGDHAGSAKPMAARQHEEAHS